MKTQIPQILVVVWLSLAVGISLAKHGNTSGKENFFLSLLGAILFFLLLWWGGFFQ